MTQKKTLGTAAVTLASQFHYRLVLGDMIKKRKEKEHKSQVRAYDNRSTGGDPKDPCEGKELKNQQVQITTTLNFFK